MPVRSLTSDSFPLILSLFLLLFAGVDTAAQGHSHVEEADYGTDAPASLCGSDLMKSYDFEAALDRTRLEDPLLFSTLVAESEGKGAARRAAGSDFVGAEMNFSVTDRTTGRFVQVPATLMHVGDSILIWVDNRDTGHLKPETIEALAIGLESAVRQTPNTRDADVGLVGNNIAIFGAPPVPVEDRFPGYLCSFLLTDIDEGALSNGIIEGYFSPWDQTANPGSNRTNLLYIDSRQSLGNQTKEEIDGVIGTMAHEFQHLINHGRYVGNANDASAHWIYNEGLSEVAALRNGYSERSADAFLQNPNGVSFFTRPSSGTDGTIILQAYERGMLFVHYLSQRFGDELLYHLTEAPGSGLEPVRRAMIASGHGSDAEQVYADFWVANYLRSGAQFEGDPIYYYRDPLHSRMKRTDIFSIPSEPATYEVELVGHGAYAQRMINTSATGEGVFVRFASSVERYGAHALVMGRDGTFEVRRIEPGVEYAFDDFIQIAFVIANTGSGNATASWTVSRGTLGVEEYGSTPELFAVTGVAPNPMTGSGAVTFTSKEATGVTAELFDIRGEQVGTIVADHRAEAGTHTLPFSTEGLTPGVYTIRLRDSQGNLAVRQVVIVR